MGRIISLSTLLVVLSFHIFAQTKNNEVQQERPNFDGIWILEEVERPRDLNIKDYKNYVLVISTNKNELKISKSYTWKESSTAFELVLFIDKRGEKNIILDDNLDKGIERKSKTYIKKNKIISEYKSKMKLYSRAITFHGVEKYYLSKDNSRLTFETVQTYASSPFFTKHDNYKFVFLRKSK